MAYPLSCLRENPNSERKVPLKDPIEKGHTPSTIGNRSSKLMISIRKGSPKSLLDLGKGTRGLEELHWDAGLSLRGIGDCLLGWGRSTGDLNLGSSKDRGNRNLDWSKLSLTVPSDSCWTKSKSGFRAGS